MSRAVLSLLALSFNLLRANARDKLRAGQTIASEASFLRPLVSFIASLDRGCRRISPAADSGRALHARCNNLLRNVDGFLSGCPRSSSEVNGFGCKNCCELLNGQRRCRQ